MFTYIYNFTFYRFLKSGLLIDFFIKKFIFYKIKFLFYYYSILFSEKFFIEYNFLVINKYVQIYKNIFNVVDNLLIIQVLSVLIAIMFILLLVTIL